ncbi:MAG: hypothetical protein JST01_29310 [Cyanobacteria bacterium SZAS TMP-1]|nr:hypothetical protein [Cyanobacteria bacterium SZAS TMP-1]
MKTALTVSMLIALLSWSACPADAAGNEVWLLHQQHIDRGAIDTYVARDAVKIVSLRNGYAAICKAPDWDVHFFRASEKQEWIIPVDQFNGVMLVNPMTTRDKKNTDVMKPVKKGESMGLRYTRFAPNAASRSSLDCADDIVTSPRVTEFLSRLYLCPDPGKVLICNRADRGNRPRLPDKKGGALELDFGNDLRSGVVEYVTTRSWEKIPYRASDFTLPVNFQRTKNLTQITFTREQKDELNEAFSNEVIFLSPSTNKKKEPTP